MSAEHRKKDTKWHKIMDYIYCRRGGGPVYAAELQAVGVAAFLSDPSSVTARLRELSAAGFLLQARGRRTPGGKLLTYYICCTDHWHHWTHGGPEALRVFLKQKRKARRPATVGRAADEPLERGPGRSPGAQLTLGDAAEPPGHWQHG